MTVNYADMDNLWAFLGLGVVTVANLATTVIDRRRGKTRADAREKKLNSIERSVNNRPDTMRDQLDRIESDLRGVKKDVGRLADAAVDDRETHRTDIARLDRDIDDLKRRN